MVFAVGRERVGTPTSWFRRTVGVVERAYSGPFEVFAPYLAAIINYMYRTRRGLDYPFIIIRLATSNYAFPMPLQFPKPLRKVISEITGLRFSNWWSLGGYQWTETLDFALQWEGNFPYLALEAMPGRVSQSLNYNNNNDKCASPTPTSVVF